MSLFNSWTIVMRLFIGCLLHIAVLTQTQSMAPLATSRSEDVLLARPASVTPQIATTDTRLRVGPVDVAPSGWRRTINGWELAEAWPVDERDVQATILHRVIAQQRQVEQASVGGRLFSDLMGFVRSVDPVTIVCSQIALLAMYITLVFHRESKTADRSCKTKTSQLLLPRPPTV